MLAYTPAVTSGGNHGNEVALTFDDGPGPYTPRLVATLNRLHVHATFFAIGEMERYFSEGTRDELRSGDVVGDHTETHPMLAMMSAQPNSTKRSSTSCSISNSSAARGRGSSARPTAPTTRPLGANCARSTCSRSYGRPTPPTTGFPA